MRGSSDVGYEVKTAREIVALDFAGLTLARNAHSFQAAISECGDRPTIDPVRDATKLESQTGGLSGFAGNQQHFQGEARHSWARGLFADTDHLCTAFTRICGDCEQQRTGSGDDDAFSRYVEAGFCEGLQSAGAHDVGKGPAGKRQEKFARAGGEN